jgi:hypothetical protein
MRDLAELAQQIRATREAERRFLSLWRRERVLIAPNALDRLADDMAAAHREFDEDDCRATRGRFGSGGGYPPPRNWSMNTRGGADGEL